MLENWTSPLNRTVLAYVPLQGLTKIVVLFLMIEEIVQLVLIKNGSLSKLLISMHPSLIYFSWNNFAFPLLRDTLFHILDSVG